MRRYRLLGLLLAAVFVFCAAAQATTINYGTIGFSGTFASTNKSDIWDLTKGDVTVSYTVDLTGVTGITPYAEIGLRSGSSNFNPTGQGGWMVSNVGSLTPSPGTLSSMDKNQLQSTGGAGETAYNATAPNTVGAAFGTNVNYGIWFDRDSVDAFQAGYWGAANGDTYNTGGIYDIVISYHAINGTSGTMFATVNGVQQGFYTGAWMNAQPGIFPAGLGFSGDMTQMQLFGGMWSPANYGSVTMTNVTVSSVPEPTSIALAGAGLLLLASRFRRNTK